MYTHIPDEDFWAFSCSKSYVFVKEYRDCFWQSRVKRTRPCDIWRSIRQYSACEKLSISGGELRVIFGHFIRNENQYQDCREKGSFMKANEIVLGNIENI